MRAFLILCAVASLCEAGPMGVFFTDETSRLELFPSLASVAIDSFRLEDSALAQAAALARIPLKEKRVVFERVLSKEGLAGYIYRAQELGKVENMDFAVALDAEGKVLRVLLTAYRESIGGEVKSKRFMGQFRGRHYGSRLQLNHDIDGISGATISSRAVTLGVRKAVCLWKIAYGKP